jgi:NADPH2:quinone reductase
MSPAIPKTMKAAVIDKFGGPEELHVTSIPVAEPGEREILIRVHTAGIGVWDPWLREGGMGADRFPLVLGSDGSGTVAACGSKVRRFKVGDSVYGYAFGNPKGGFYAEYAAISEDAAAPIPAGIGSKEAGALMASGLTALSGLDKLKVKKGQTLMILGASGGVGHVALQLAKRLGARLLAVASGRDGMDLVRRLGADDAVNGRTASLAKTVRELAPGGVDLALAFANSESLREVLKQVKKGGVIAYPNGVEPEPKGPAGVKVTAFDGLASANAYFRLDRLIAKGPFHVEISRTYRLEEAAQAHRDVLKHHIGKLAFKLHD